MPRLRSLLPFQKIAAALHAARVTVSARARMPDLEDPQTASRFRSFVESQHESLVTAARHEVQLAYEGRAPPAVALATRAGLAYERAWLRAVRGAHAEEEQFRVLATLALAGGMLNGRDPQGPEEDARWVERTLSDSFDPHLVVRGFEWAGTLAIPVVRGPWAVGVAAALLGLVAAAPAFTGASVLYEARRSALHGGAQALLPQRAATPAEPDAAEA